ncbi:TPA: threonine--tRNA ligase [Candidatus Woesearchaeota archaeon]|nr:threonine--tRNA ligase [Candidatus Woesearchaeota archaeon]HII69503.1 threonine--tRNA ligase [Candidatus Woesearchaeota archaeon]
MKILSLHADFITFKATKKAIKSAKEVDTAEKKVDECLVILSAVEKRDEQNPEAVASQYVKEIMAIASQVKADSIVLYPYVHLTSEPSDPATAEKVLDLAEEALSQEFTVTRSPFGWYKSFTVACKGHPLAELSREFSHDSAVVGKTAVKKEGDDESESLKKERKLTSYWHILTPGGELRDVGDFDYQNFQKLKAFAFYEKEKSRAVTQEPEHVRIMKKLELVDYEPASDGGNLRYYPKGRLMKSLVEEYVTMRVIEYGGQEVESPIMYDIDHPTLSKYLARFPARQYRITSDKRTYFLRFAACFGQFLMAHDATISYKHLPLKLYEMTRYSFRREQSGELTGLRRLRAFTMPDCHALVADLPQAMEEFKVRFELCRSVLDATGVGSESVEMALRTTKQFYAENKEYIHSIVRAFGKPILLEMWDERIFYFVLKYEFNFVDTMGKASALSTDQIDIENGERYDIAYMDRDGKKKHPLILHCSPSGAVERVLYALLEKAAFAQAEGKKPQLPLWINPIQVRVIPVSEGYNEHAMAVCDELRSAGIRADIDDRTLNVGKKIRAGEMEWASYIVVVGEKEKASGNLTVRSRSTSEQKERSLEELQAEIKDAVKGMPFKPLSIPKELSRRVTFVG